VLDKAGGGLRTTDLDTCEVLELLEVLGRSIGELLGVPQLDELEVREIFTDAGESFVIKAVTMEVDALQLGPAIELREEVTWIAGASWCE
jgi:hypothetical protein